MERRVLWMVLLLGAALSLGCGDDSSGGSAGDGNQGGSGGDDGESGTGGGGPIGGDGVACGTIRCVMPEGATAEPCCFDLFSSVCGMRGGLGGTAACVSIVESDPRCPNVMGPIMLTGCCTADNQCGITSPFNMNCTELSVAEQMAMDRAMMFNMDEDGGVASGGGGVGGGGAFPMIDFPPPQACE